MTRYYSVGTVPLSIKFMSEDGVRRKREEELQVFISSAVHTLCSLCHKSETADDHKKYWHQTTHRSSVFGQHSNQSQQYRLQISLGYHGAHWNKDAQAYQHHPNSYLLSIDILVLARRHSSCLVVHLQARSTSSCHHHFQNAAIIHPCSLNAMQGKTA